MQETVIQDAQRAIASRAAVVASHLNDLAAKDPFWNSVATVFAAAYQNPILTTAELLSSKPLEIYAGTGGWGCYGPPAAPPSTGEYPNALADMWIRDACAQYHAYLGIFADKQADPSAVAAVGAVIEGIVRTCADFLTREPANITVHAFTKDGQPSAAGMDYEPDSLAYVVFLAWAYQAASGSTKHLDTYFWKAMRATIQVLRSHLHTFEDGSALTETPVRPSDDRAERLFNVPVNAFCAVAMERLADLATHHGSDPQLASDAADLGAALRKGVMIKGVATYGNYGQIFAYETDAGVDSDREPLLMDDANIPSILSLPYLGFCAADDPIYRASRTFVLSPDNRYYYTGSDGTTRYAGIGSAHTDNIHGGTSTSIWPMAIIMQGLTSASIAERKETLTIIVAAAQAKITCTNSLFGCTDDPGLCQKYPPSGYIHESFDANDPTSYTRGWFAWANALYGEWIDTMAREGTLPS